MRLTPFQAEQAKRRALLARGWQPSRAVGERLGAPNPAQHAAELRAEGRLLGCWAADAGTYVHPDCQFDADGRPLDVMLELLALLPAKGDEGGWRRAFWLYGSRDELDRRAPADLLASEPDRVLALARTEFSSSTGC